MKLIAVDIGYAFYGIVVKNDIVVDVAPIAGWMIDKKWEKCKTWLENKNAMIFIFSDEYQEKT